MSRTAVDLRPRRLWLTAPVYLVLVVVAGVDIWAGVFWASVGGTLGSALAAAAGLVVVLLIALLVVDARRQWRLHRWAAERLP
jgi:membrane protein YdbS with pleckstrin-like domain